MDTVGDAYIVAVLIPEDAAFDTNAQACAAVLRLAAALLRAVAAAPHPTDDAVGTVLVKEIDRLSRGEREREKERERKRQGRRGGRREGDGEGGREGGREGGGERGGGEREGRRER